MKVAPGANFRTVIQRHPRVSVGGEGHSHTAVTAVAPVSCNMCVRFVAVGTIGQHPRAYPRRTTRFREERKLRAWKRDGTVGRNAPSFRLPS